MATYLERLWSEAQSCGVDRMVFDLTLAPIVLEMEFRHDALQSRLAAAEAEAARASGLLQRWFDDDESYEAYRALVDETLAHLASRPEGEVRDGRV